MAWSKDNIEKFIDLYRSYPCLWKIKCDDYKNKNLRNRAYEVLIEFCKSAVCPNANKDFVTKKIQGLRGVFRKELKKTKNSYNSGSGQEDVYKPSLWYFDLLLFTKDQEEPTESISNIGSDVHESISVECEPEIRGIQEKENETEKKEQEIQNVGQVPDNTRFFAKRKLSKRKANAMPDNVEFIAVCQRALEKSAAETTEYEAVGISVGKKLEKMRATQAIYAESLINVILSKGLLNQLTPNTTVSEVRQNVASSETNSNPSFTSSSTINSPTGSYIQSPTASYQNSTVTP